jgi:hypothetical protein
MSYDLLLEGVAVRRTRLRMGRRRHCSGRGMMRKGRAVGDPAMDGPD